MKMECEKRAALDCQRSAFAHPCVLSRQSFDVRLFGFPLTLPSPARGEVASVQTIHPCESMYVRGKRSPQHVSDSVSVDLTLPCSRPIHLW